jgi:hypothetical protein
MTTKTVEYPVTFFDFKSWLESQNKHKIVGEAAVCSHCPVATFLKEEGYNQDIVIYSDRTYISNKKFENPEWVKEFVSKVDIGRLVGTLISAEDALEIVSNLYICTVCNKYNPEGTNCGKKDNCPW